MTLIIRCKLHFHKGGANTSTTREVPKEATWKYNLRRNVKIRSPSYRVKNMLILTKKFKNISLKVMDISKDFKEMKRKKPTKIGEPSPLNF